MSDADGFTFQFKIEDEEQIRRAQNQGDSVLQISSKIKNNQILSAFERDFIVAVLKGAAENLHNFKPRKPVGHQPVLVHSDVCLKFYSHILQGNSHNSAYELTAEYFECEVNAIKRHIAKDKKHGSPTKRFLESCEIVNAKPIK